jgi:hypothetical protein
MTMDTGPLDRLAFLAFGAMLWACIAAVAGLVAYAQAGIVGGLIAVAGATLLVVALALAMFRSVWSG